jgi:hypothetical protein
MEKIMSLLFVLGLWLFLGGSIYRAHKHARSAPEHPTSGETKVVPLRRPVRTKIPDTVPSEWIETYRAEHGG